MRKSTSPLTPAQVYRFAVDFCQPHLDFQAVGKVTAKILLTSSSPPPRASPRSPRPAAAWPMPPARRPTPRPSTPTSSPRGLKRKIKPPSPATCPGPCAAPASGRSASPST